MPFLNKMFRLTLALCLKLLQASRKSINIYLQKKEKRLALKIDLSTENQMN